MGHGSFCKPARRTRGREREPLWRAERDAARQRKRDREAEIIDGLRESRSVTLREIHRKLIEDEQRRMQDESL